MSNHLVGKTIAKVRTLTEAEQEEFYLDDPTEVIEFTDGSLLVALADPEGNGPGQLIYAQGDQHFYVTAE